MNSYFYDSFHGLCTNDLYGSELFIDPVKGRYRKFVEAEKIEYR